jgi:hypothetical protein
VLFINLLISLSFAKLGVLSTKQSIDNLRFISNDGKITYYQVKSGALSLSSNYKNSIVIKGSKNTQYNLYSSPHRKKIAIEEDPDFHTNYSLQKNNLIHVIDYGNSKATEIGKGVNPKLHLNDTWVSFYKPIERVIVLRFLDLDERTIRIPLNNKVNIFYYPEVEMISPNIVFFTDINSKGFMGITKYTASTKEYVNIIKSKFNGTKFEMCKKKNKLIVGEFSYPHQGRGSSIIAYDINGVGRPTGNKLLYSASSEDPGNLVCHTSDDSIYFVKQIEDGIGKHTEAAQVNTKNGNLNVASELKFVGQIISMDGRVLIPMRDKFYVLSGKMDEKKDEFTKN